MAKATVELTGSQSHTARGRTFRKGQPQVLTSASDIAYYQGQSGFSVLIHNEAPPKVKAKAAAPVASEPEDDGEEDLDADDEGGEEGGEAEAPPKATKPTATPAKPPKTKAK